MRHGGAVALRCVFIGHDMAELAIRNNGRASVEGAGGAWSLFDNVTVIRIPDNDPSGAAGLYVWILSH